MTLKNWKANYSKGLPNQAYCMRKSKLHPKYREVFSENTVLVLRQKARSAGTKGWYSLRKGNLASAIIVHDSAMTVTKLFHDLVEAKRLEVYETHRSNGSSCPISLTPVSELNADDIYVHGGVVFSKESALGYVRASADFLNPITRTMMHLHDIERLGCQYALDKYRDRVVLRDREINSIRQFSFLETELENLLFSLVHNYYHRDTEFFMDTLTAFQQTWIQMKNTDRNRTVCVLRSLVQSVARFRGRPRQWGNDLVLKYLVKTN